MEGPGRPVEACSITLLHDLASGKEQALSMNRSGITEPDRSGTGLSQPRRADGRDERGVPGNHDGGRIRPCSRDGGVSGWLRLICNELAARVSRAAGDSQRASLSARLRSLRGGSPDPAACTAAGGEYGLIPRVGLRPGVERGANPVIVPRFPKKFREIPEISCHTDLYQNSFEAVRPLSL